MDEVDGKPGHVALQFGHLDAPKDAPKSFLCQPRSSSHLKLAGYLVLEAQFGPRLLTLTSFAKIGSTTGGRMDLAPLQGARRNS
jgi:hypothetical protein